MTEEATSIFRSEKIILVTAILTFVAVFLALAILFTKPFFIAVGVLIFIGPPIAKALFPPVKITRTTTIRIKE